MEKKTKRIMSLEIGPMTDVFAHSDCNGIERYSTSEFPIQIAAHKIKRNQNIPSKDYCDRHSHTDCDELNIILPGPGGLVYEVELGGKCTKVSGPTAIWIEKGIDHSANAVEGEGWFVCIRFNQ